LNTPDCVDTDNTVLATKFNPTQAMA